jgi:hypothetical protein
MRFVLTYDGLLPSSGSPSDKHNIRVQIHRQLKRQWDVDPCLTSIRNEKPLSPRRPNESSDLRQLEKLSTYELVRFSCGSFCFIPLVTKNLHLTCSLDITFLRPEEPGQLIRHGGDIDNRIKILFDGLRVPRENEVSAFSTGEGEEPFYCLLEDDSLVTGLQVRTERLLVPLEPPATSSVRLVMTVVVRPTRITFLNVPFLSDWP